MKHFCLIWKDYIIKFLVIAYTSTGVHMKLFSFLKDRDICLFHFLMMTFFYFIRRVISFVMKRKIKCAQKIEFFYILLIIISRTIIEDIKAKLIYF